MPTKQRSAKQSTDEETATNQNAETESDDERSQESGNDVDLQNFLEEQVTRAIEPVLADFREQMTQAVQHEMEHAFSANGGDAPGGKQQAGGGAIESEVVDRRTPSDQKKEQRPEEGEDREQESQPRSDSGGGDSLPSKLTQRVQPLTSNVLHGLEGKAEDWLRSMIVTGLTTALSEASRGIIQERAEKGLDALLQRGFDALPDSSNKRELQTQTKRTLHGILRDVLDAVYAEDVRKELQSHGEKAVGSLMQRDLDQAFDGIKQAVQTVGEEILTVLRKQWQKVLRLMFKLIMAALDSSFSSDEEDS